MKIQRILPTLIILLVAYSCYAHTNPWYQLLITARNYVVFNQICNNCSHIKESVAIPFNVSDEFVNVFVKTL